MRELQPNLPLAKWLNAITPSMRQMLSRMAGTSESMYRQWVQGRRGLSAEKAGALEEAMIFLHARHPGVPDPLTRGDLCEACRKCPYFSGKGPSAIEVEELSVDDML